MRKSRKRKKLFLGTSGSFKEIIKNDLNSGPRQWLLQDRFEEQGKACRVQDLSATEHLRNALENNPEKIPVLLTTGHIQGSAGLDRSLEGPTCYWAGGFNVVADVWTFVLSWHFVSCISLIKCAFILGSDKSGASQWNQGLFCFTLRFTCKYLLLQKH